MSDSTPLLVQFPESEIPEPGAWERRLREARRAARRFLASRAKHRAVLALVALDVAGILGDISVGSAACELGAGGGDDEPWVWVGPTRRALAAFSLAVSCVFVLELALSVLADGLGYFKEKLHCFDAFVIVTGFAVDLLEHGVVGEIASLVVVLRLWRFVKIADELSVEASEQMGELRQRIEDLEKQNRELRSRLDGRGARSAC